MALLNGLFPKVIYNGSSKYNKDIKVIQLGETRKLIVNGIVQSLSNNSSFAKGKVWGKLVKTIEDKKPEVNNILLLGMGAGTMIHLINKHYKNVKLTSVEIDQTIVDVATEFFGLNEINNNQTIVADAFDVVLNPKNYGISNKFDCIILDTYMGGALPNNISTNEFFMKFAELAQIDGLIVINRIVYKEEKDKANAFIIEMEKLLNNVTFSVVKYPSIADNYIISGFAKQN